ILIAPVAALRRILPPPSYWEQHQLQFVTGEEIRLDNYLSTLVDMGYEHANMVTTPGEFSRRGGIIDIYPVTENYSIRFELFYNVDDFIQFFNAEDQRSLSQLVEVMIGPETEILLT